MLASSEQRRRIAEATGIPAPTLKDYASGRTSPPLDRFLLIVSAAGRDPISFFSPPAIPNAGVTLVPVLDIRPSAGPGQNADVVSAVGDLPFPVAFAQKIAPHGADLSCMRCAGDSMAPTIQDGALLILDERQREPRKWMAGRTRQAPPQDDIFVFYHSDDLRLKRVRDLGEGFLAILSDNPRQAPEIIKPGRDGAIRIIGKVVWWDNRL